MDVHHRKIELQAPEDLSYLLANVRRAAAARIDEAFPPVDGAGEDELRTRIEELVNEYITKTFTLAAPNLSINGLPLDAASSPADLAQYLSGTASSNHHPFHSNNGGSNEPDEVYAPFDARLRARVEELTREEEDLLRDIAALKKTVPAAATAGWAEAARRGVRADEEALAARKGEGEGEAQADAGDANGSPDKNNNNIKEEGALKIEPLERQADVEKAYETAVHGLGRLKREMPAVTAKMERARNAGAYVVTER